MQAARPLDYYVIVSWVDLQQNKIFNVYEIYFKYSTNIFAHDYILLKFLPAAIFLFDMKNTFVIRISKRG